MAAWRPLGSLSSWSEERYGRLAQRTVGDVTVLSLSEVHLTCQLEAAEETSMLCDLPV